MSSLDEVDKDIWGHSKLGLSLGSLSECLGNNRLQQKSGSLATFGAWIYAARWVKPLLAGLPGVGLLLGI